MRRTIIAAVAALMCTSAGIALAQDKPEQKQPSQQQKQPTDQKKEQAEPSSGQKAKQEGSTATKYNEMVSYKMENGCQYAATVKGTLNPMKSTSGAKAKEPKSDKNAKGEMSEKMYEPNLNVSATVTCPAAMAMRTSDVIAKTGPLTRDQLEETLERRAAIVSDASGQRCIYMADFTLSEQKLAVDAVAYLCPMQTKSGQQGSGNKP